MAGGPTAAQLTLNQLRSASEIVVTKEVVSGMILRIKFEQQDDLNAAEFRGSTSIPDIMGVVVTSTCECHCEVIHRVLRWTRI